MKRRRNQNRLVRLQRFVPGNIKMLGWDLDYVDSHALWSCIDVLVYRRWNDFISSKKAPAILDCGANVGISVLNYKRMYPDARITAFEPDPAIVKVLKRNLGANGAADVKVVEAAVWTQPGTTKFFTEGADGSRIVTGKPESSDRTVVVETVDLADYISEPIDLIKMDIEGAEFDVIRRIQPQLHLVSNLVIECHLDNGRAGEMADMLVILAAAGFKVSINSYGAWRDLVHKPGKLVNEFDQYFLLAAWRD
jgi:FkbM family methyltransferase